MRKNLSLLITGLALLTMLAVPAMAQEEIPTIEKMPAGFDVWQTLGSGATSYGFGNDPIPKDFFCFGSEPFKGMIEFDGEPVKTEPANYLGKTDTIIERLDDAVFDKSGLAKSRIQIRALSLAGSTTIKNSCGEWSVKAGLAEEQPVGEMIFNRTYSVGGEAHADLWINARLVFTHTKTGEVLEITRLLNLPTGKKLTFACSKTCPKPVSISIGTVAVGGAALGKLSVGTLNPLIIDIRPNDFCSTGCACGQVNGVLQCLPTFPYHETCNPPPIDPVALAKCEKHFTTTPCNLYGVQCEPNTLVAKLAQLQDLYRKGIIHDEPEVALEKLGGKR